MSRSKGNRGSLNTGDPHFRLLGLCLSDDTRKMTRTEDAWFDKVRFAERRRGDTVYPM